jgi:4-amino-4-deoxy-L-arabinose transferase-like glycosyltransferase
MPTKRGLNTRTKKRAAAAVPRSANASRTTAETWDWLKPALLAGVLVFAWLGQDQLFARQLLPGLAFWLVAAALLVVSVWKPAPAAEPEMKISKPLEAAILLGVLLLAAVVRTWNLANQPNGFSFDEAANGLIGLQMILDPAYVPIFGPPDAPLPTLFHYFNSLALRLGGVNVAAARLVPAFFGILTVGAFYFLARRIFSRPVALVAVFLLAVMRWHINFSRIDFVGAATPFFGAAAAYFLLRGLETRNRWHMALSGLAVALGLYTYYASNLVPFVLGPYMVWQLASDRKNFREQGTNILVFLAVSLLVFAPLGHFALTQKDRFFARNGQVLIFNHVSPAEAWPAFWANVKTTLLMFNYFGDCNGRHNIPEVPMLDFTTGLLFGLGLVWSLKNIQRRHAFLAVLWFLVALIPGFLTIEAPQGYRCIGAIVPVALLAGFGLEFLWQGTLSLVRAAPLRRWLWLGLIPLGLWVGYQNLSDYFDRQANAMACWSEFAAREAAMGKRLHELGGQYHAYISAGSFDYPTIRFLAYPVLDSEPFSMVQSVPSNYLGNKNLEYCLLQVHENAREMLKYYYPGAQINNFQSPFDFDLFTEVRVSAAELLKGRGVAAEYTGESGKVLRRQDGAREFILEPQDAPFPGELRVHWSGSLRVSTWEAYMFRVEGAAQAKIFLDRHEVSANGVELSQGLHVLDIQASFPANRRVSVLWKRQGAEAWGAIPGSNLSPRAQVHGLAGTYFTQTNWQGAAYLKRVDPFMSLLGADFPLSAPFSVRWEGTITAPVEGVYTFGTLNNEASWLYLDNKLVVANSVADGYSETAVRLTAGRHRLRIDYQKREGAYPTLILNWTPPRQAKQKVPFTVLEPEW